MSFSNKEIRCHILDRKDQLAMAKEWQERDINNFPKLQRETFAKIATLYEELDAHEAGIAKRQEHIDYLESTMDIQWIDNPPY